MIVQRRKARSSGTVVEVIDNRDRHFMDDNQRWYTLCDDHSGLCSHQTRALAVSWSAEPESWCPGCQESRDGDTP